MTTCIQAGSKIDHCFPRRHRLARYTRPLSMFGKRKTSSKRRIWTVAYGLLLLGLLLAFLVTIDGPLTNFGSNAVPVAILQNEPAVPPASFFLFDYKQNLRLWPVLAGDISRSPPLF